MLLYLFKLTSGQVKDGLAEVCHLGYDISNVSVDAASHEVKASLVYIHDDSITVERAREQRVLRVKLWDDCLSNAVSGRR